MPSTAKDLGLPTPATVQPIDETAVLISSVGRLPFHHVPDPTLHPRRFLLTWRDASGAVGDAIRRHYDDFPNDVFTFKVPRTGEVVFAKWSSPPSIQWRSTTTVGGVSAEVEEALAHE